MTSIICGFAYQFYPFFGFWSGLPIYLMGIASSGVMFYDYIICDYQNKNDGYNWRCFSSNDHVKGSYCEEKWEVIWEKV